MVDAVPLNRRLFLPGSEMAGSLKGVLKLTCAAVSLSWIGSQSLLFYHLKFSKGKDAFQMMPSDAIPLSVKEERKGLVNAVMDMYGLRYSRDNILYYDKNASFEDPAVLLEGRSAIASGFSSMGKAFRKSENIKMDVMHGKNLVVIDQVQKYTMVGNISLELPSVIYLHLKGEKGDERIMRHVEEWGGKALIGKDAPYVANIGYLAAQFRKVHGWPFKYIIPATDV